MCNQRLPPRHVLRVHGAFTDTCTCQQGADFTKGWKLASRCRSSRSKFHRSKVSTRTIRRAFCLLTWDDAGSELAIVSKPVPHLCCGPDCGAICTDKAKPPVTIPMCRSTRPTGQICRYAKGLSGIEINSNPFA
jgi:hypothetical protein